MISDRTRSNLTETFTESLLPKLGLLLLVSMVVMAIFAPVLATHDPTRTGYYTEEGTEYPPIGYEYSTTVAQEGEFGEVTVESSSEHVLGTNNVGQDVYSRFVYGARVSILVGLLATALALLIGVPIGLVSGYYGGRIDDGLMRIADVMLAFPALVLALALIGVFGTSPVFVPDPVVQAGLADGMPEQIPIPGSVTVVGALVIWVWFARVARGEALSLRNQEYVKASKSFGMSDTQILLKHVLPNSLTPIIVLATIQVAVIILLEASLAYLGFSGTTLSWGYEIERGQDVLRTRPWVSIVPGIGIMLAVIGVNLLGDWFRDALDPNIEGGERGA
ncbi:ABC transporter permease [Natronobacterium gregoryi]|uniref:ABC transporter permease n=2 Tax=Natronobacterium gregoryi TaxID=44930 RepID=L0AMY7_NATGS|nr:ABC transporter permease [Natronobacterium gregoryi]AFZ74839.1 ABC-type dipeptide/oligopeptide/nickel transport system, permease component [Natronobacterium gregoryi SP2]ELY64586.1 binding-protein-dependent transporters inner membrane component [Natronobacterium gregoryi SP2]PLK18127.1 ABC transporter permease [Natronobacterium gregoryi SP2]SFJ66351.1 peptide/nickel transport system permease protein [Natronobacterium gregoryi]